MREVLQSIDHYKINDYSAADGKTLLHVAASKDHTQFVRYLAWNGALINIQKNNGYTAYLKVVVKNSQINCVI